MTKRVRTPIPIPVQVEVLFRHNWLCYLCRRPLVFPLAMRQLEDLTRQQGIDPPPAYFNQQWRRDLAVQLGAGLGLRSGDALYAAVARRRALPLVSWDKEPLERAGAVTPEEWLVRAPAQP